MTSLHVAGTGEVNFNDFLTVMARKIKESDLNDEMLTLFRGKSVQVLSHERFALTSLYLSNQTSSVVIEI